MELSGADKRSQRRVEAAIPIHVRGVDAQGREFEDSNVAVEVSRRGLSFLTKYELPVFASLSVVIPGRGPVIPGEGPTDFFAEATVVRSTLEGDNLYRVGLRFMGATLPMYSSESL